MGQINSIRCTLNSNQWINNIIYKIRLCNNYICINNNIICFNWYIWCSSIIITFTNIIGIICICICVNMFSSRCINNIIRFISNIIFNSDYFIIQLHNTHNYIIIWWYIYIIINKRFIITYAFIIIALILRKFIIKFISNNGSSNQINNKHGLPSDKFPNSKPTRSSSINNSAVAFDGLMKQQVAVYGYHNRKYYHSFHVMLWCIRWHIMCWLLWCISWYIIMHSTGHYDPLAAGYYASSEGIFYLFLLHLFLK